MAIPSEYAYIEDINNLYTKNFDNSSDFPDIYAIEIWNSAYGSSQPIANVNNRDYTMVASGSRSFYINGVYNYHNPNSSIYNNGDIKVAPFLPAYAEINVNQSQNGYTITYPEDFRSSNPYPYPTGRADVELGKSNNSGNFYLCDSYSAPTLLTDFNTLASAISYIYSMFSNIVLYVDGDKWIDDRPVTYNWQSVPSISGKNGILSLVTLDSESINDGEPVSGAAVSVFDQAPSNDNNIKNLADTYGGEEESSAVDVTVKYKVTLPPGGSFSALKIVAKKDSAPEDASDGDNIVDISPTKTKKTISDLDENSLYYFKIFGEDTNGNTSESDEKHINTSEEEGVPFDYTGSIQEFTVPETGMYSLETWGAQGQNAGNNRGGYGAYAYAEAFLTEGQKLYIGIGGQNGYNGGGNYTSGSIRNIPIPEYSQSIIMDNSLWNNNWSSGNVAVGSKPKTFTLSYDFLDLLMNATLGTESVLIYERNGVQIFGMRDAENATYGGYYKYSIYVKDNGVIVAGSQNPTAYYSQAWYLASGFDKRDNYYNSNVWDRIQALYLGFGVDDEAQLGYLVGCTKRHEGYYQGAYINYDSFDAVKISNNTSQYGAYCNSAKLYDALKKMAGE